MSLRKKVIRLAHTKRELRPVLLPLLKTAFDEKTYRIIGDYVKKALEQFGPPELRVVFKANDTGVTIAFSPTGQMTKSSRDFIRVRIKQVETAYDTEFTVVLGVFDKKYWSGMTLFPRDLSGIVRTPPSNVPGEIAERFGDFIATYVENIELMDGVVPPTS